MNASSRRELGRRFFNFLENNIGHEYNISNITGLATLKLIRYCVNNGIPFGSGLKDEQTAEKLKMLEDFYINGANLDKWTSRQPVWKNAFNIKRPVQDLKSSILEILHYHKEWPGCDYPELWQEFLEIMSYSPYGEYSIVQTISEEEFPVWTGRLCQEWVLYKSLRLFPDRRSAKFLNDLIGSPYTPGEEVEYRGAILLPDCLGFTNSYKNGKLYCNYNFCYVIRDENQPERLCYFEQIISPDRISSNVKIYQTGDRVVARGITGKNRRDLLLDMWLNDLELTSIKSI